MARLHDVAKTRHQRMVTTDLRVLRKKPFALKECRALVTDHSQAHRNDVAHHDAPDEIQSRL
jgi:hypothetical protein